MDESKRQLRQAGERVRTLAASVIDLEADLAATLRRMPSWGADDDHGSGRSSSRRGIYLGAAAAVLVVGLVGALVVVVDRESEGDRVTTSTPEPSSSLAPVETLSEVTTSDPASTDTPTTTDGPATTPVPAPAVPVALPLPPQPVTVPVSYRDPPAVYDPVPFASVPASGGDTSYYEYAVGDGMVAVVRDGVEVALVEPTTGEWTATGLAQRIGLPVLGPDNVLYGMAFGLPPADPNSAMPGSAVVAQPLDGSSAASVVASMPVDTNKYVEVPAGTLVLGPDGIYDVHRGGGRLMDFVDTGAEVSEAVRATVLAVEADYYRSLVRTNDAEWLVPVEEDPNAASPFTSSRPPAPGPHGSTRVERYIGPKLETEPVDFGTPTHPVIADLRPGAGQWRSLPDGWEYAASSAGGTLLARDLGDEIELAWFDPPDPPALPLARTTVLASGEDGFVAITRDEQGIESARVAPERSMIPNGCTTDAIDALFGEVPAGSVLERVVCDLSAPAVAGGEFSTAGLRSTIRVVQRESGWTTDIALDSPEWLRLVNLRPVPIVIDDELPLGDTTPTSANPLPPIPPSQIPPALPVPYEIAQASTSGEEFATAMRDLFADGGASVTTATFTSNDDELVVIIEQVGTAAVDRIVHYYWLTRLRGSSQLSLRPSFDTLLCADGHAPGQASAECTA